MRITPIVVLAALLAAAPPAAAKEILSVQACGTDRCTTTKHERVLAVMRDGGAPTRAPGDPGPVVVLRASIGDPNTGEGGSYLSAWVPRHRLVVSEDGTWMRVSKPAQLALDELARGLRPFPARQLERLRYSEIDLPTAAPAPQPSPRAAEDGGPPWWLLAPAAIATWLGIAVLVRRIAPRPAPTSS